MPNVYYELDIGSLAGYRAHNTPCPLNLSIIANSFGDDLFFYISPSLMTFKTNISVLEGSVSLLTMNLLVSKNRVR